MRALPPVGEGGAQSCLSKGQDPLRLRPDGTKPVTYSLVAGGQNSEEYYRNVRRFADEVLDRASRSLVRTVEGFRDYVRTFRTPPISHSGRRARGSHGRA